MNIIAKLDVTADYSKFLCSVCGEWLYLDNYSIHVRMHEKEMEMDDTAKLLEERGKTHGDFAQHAATTQALKQIVRQRLTSQSKWLGAEHLEAIDMILHKIGRIIAGDPNFRDHWDDIAGYARLGSEACEPKSSS